MFEGQVRKKKIQKKQVSNESLDKNQDLTTVNQAPERIRTGGKNQIYDFHDLQGAKIIERRNSTTMGIERKNRKYKDEQFHRFSMNQNKLIEKKLKANLKVQSIFSQ